MNSPVKNRVTASLQFDFRGERFKPRISVDLDALMQRHGELNDLYDMLATSIGLDAYRHEYDVMLMHDILFSEPTGMTSQFINNGRLDFEAFTKAWQQQYILNAVQPVARKYLDIIDLDQHPDIRNALLDCYRMGQAARRRE